MTTVYCVLQDSGNDYFYSFTNLIGVYSSYTNAVNKIKDTGTNPHETYSDVYKHNPIFIDGEHFIYYISERIIDDGKE